MSSYKTTCPKCKGENFYVTPHNNTKYCFNCGYLEKSGERQEIVQSEHIETIRGIYTELAQYYHSCLDKEHITYLHARGITDRAIEHFKIGFCPSSHHKLYSHPISTESGIALKKKPFLADMIIFPYWFGDIVTDMRGRSIHGGYKTCFNGTYFRGAELPYNVNDEGKQVILAESEIKTIAAWQVGYTAWGIPGINAHRIVLHDNIIICFDNQKEHRRELNRAIKHWIHTLMRVKIAVLPLRGKEKQDIDSYILTYGEQAFKNVITSALDTDTWLKYNR